MYPTQMVPYRANVNNLDHKRLALYSYTERLTRIVEESLDVSLNVCNNECEQFGMAKLFDVFNQVLPTAFVLNTGYWPFFHTVEGQCLCICGRFAMPCRHVKNSYHWLDLMPDIPARDSPVFYPRNIGCIFPVDYNIYVQPIEDRSCLGYKINVDLKLQYKKNERGRPKRSEKQKRRSLDGRVDNKAIYNCSIISSYDLATEFYPAYYSILFKPNPIFHEHYGAYFHQIRESRTKDPWISANVQNYYPVSIDMMPKNSLVIRFVNFPTHIVPPQVIAVSPFSPPNQIKIQRPKKNKATQSTPDEERQIQILHESISKTRSIFDQNVVSVNESPAPGYSPILPPVRSDYPTRYFHNTLTDTAFLDVPPEFNNNNQYSLLPKNFPLPQSVEIKQEQRTQDDYPPIIIQPSTSSYMMKYDERERMPPVQNYASVVRSGLNINNNNNKSNVDVVPNQQQIKQEKKLNEFEVELDETYNLLQEIITEDLSKNHKNTN